jgi:hypothetical protein
MYGTKSFAKLGIPKAGSSVRAFVSALYACFFPPVHFKGSLPGPFVDSYRGFALYESI